MGPQRIELAAIELAIEFAAGEELRTEISAKFTRPRIEQDLASVGLELVGWHTDAQDWFAPHVAPPRG